MTFILICLGGLLALKGCGTVYRFCGLSALNGLFFAGLIMAFVCAIVAAVMALDGSDGQVAVLAGFLIAMVLAVRGWNNP